MTEFEARQRAEATAAKFYSDNLLGKVAAQSAIAIAMQALQDYEAERRDVICIHEAYHGQCAHCGVQIHNGKAQG